MNLHARPEPGLGDSRSACVQRALQPPCHEIRSPMRFLCVPANAYACSHRVRPIAPLAYEHMFPSSRTSTLAQRALGALRLTRSFLLLEDDYDVDWEVDRDEALTQAHPHRVPLRGPGRRSHTVASRRRASASL